MRYNQIVRTIAIIACILFVGCNNRVAQEPDPGPDNSAAQVACSSWCATFDRCEATEEGCFDDCLNWDAMRTEHCSSELTNYTQCMGDSMSCEYVIATYVTKERDEESPCPDQAKTYSDCLGEHRTEIDAELGNN